MKVTKVIRLWKHFLIEQCNSNRSAAQSKPYYLNNKAYRNHSINLITLLP